MRRCTHGPLSFKVIEVEGAFFSRGPSRNIVLVFSPDYLCVEVVGYTLLHGAFVVAGGANSKGVLLRSR